LNNLSINSGKDGIMSLRNKPKAKTSSNSAGTYSANNVMRKISGVHRSCLYWWMKGYIAWQKMLVLRSVSLQSFTLAEMKSEEFSVYAIVT